MANRASKFFYATRREFLKSAAAAGSFLAMDCSNPASIGPEKRFFSADLVKQNGKVNEAEVEKSLDAMAVALAQREDPSKSWQFIFQKGDKSWSSVTAAVKFNEVGTNMPRIAVINKICRELVNLGIPTGNITLFGGRNTGASVAPYYSMLSDVLPEGIHLSQHDSLLGGRSTVPIPLAVNGNISITQAECVKNIGEHVNDILINIGVNKGHWDEYGGFVLTMKNHFGTFNPQPYLGGRSFEERHGNFGYLLSINQSESLIGGMVPQQQLCIIDSLWASSKPNPGADGDAEPYNLLVMGTFSPAVDYLTAVKIRRLLMGCSLGANAEKILPAFGYSEQDLTGLDFMAANSDDPLGYSGKAFESPSSVTQIHPEIDNLRVVSCLNERMVG